LFILFRANSPGVDDH